MRYKFGFFLLALTIGILVGLSTAALIELIALLQQLAVGDTDRTPWMVVLIPVVGGLVVGVLLRYLPGQRIHGIADVMEASALRAGKMDVRSGGIAAVATAVSLGSGAPLGREGPAVHIGASLTSWLADTLGLDRTQSLTLLGCAAAAAVTASFNTPIAGVIFALEVIVGYYALRVFTPVVIASVGAVIVRHSLYGNEAEFSLPDYTIGSLWEMPLFACLGLVAAGVVQVFIYTVIGMRLLWRSVGCPFYLRPALAGLFIGVVALQYPLVLGVGYEGTFQALNQTLPITMLAILLVGKCFCSALAVASGMAGGVFSPALFIGAMLGGSYWFFCNLLVIDSVSSQGVYSVVGMAAVAAAMLGAPISTLLIVFELTLDYDLVIAVMLAAAMASTLMQLMPHGSFFRWQLANRGLDINTGRDQSLLRTRTIDEFITQNHIRISSMASLREIECAMYEQHKYVAIVNNEKGEFVGSLSTDALVAGTASVGRDAAGVDVMNDINCVIPESTRLSAALGLFNRMQASYAPVTRTIDGETKVIGVLYRSDVLKALYDLVVEARSEESNA